MSNIPLKDQIAELKRELAIREAVYPNWIESNRMKREDAQKYYRRMRAALHTLLDLEKEEDDHK